MPIPQIPQQMNGTWIRLMQILEAPEVNELHFEGPERCSVRTGGTLRVVEDCRFASDEELAAWCNHLLESCGSPQRIDGSNYVIEASYESPAVIARVHIVAPPVAAHVIVTIAKRSRQVMPLSMLVENGTVDNDVASMLHIAIAGRLNLVVSGGTGSGKTTLLNAMLGLVGEDERVGLLEEVPELMLAQPHVVALYNRAVPHLGRRTSMESFLGLFVEYAIDCEERSIVAEQNRSVEGFLAYLGRRAPQIEASSDEAAISLGMLVGFSGSACTIHANSAMEVPSRLQLLAAGHPAHFSPRYVNSLVSQSVDMVIHLGAPEGGQHRVTEVLAVADQVVSESTISTEPLFSWVPGEGWKRVGRMPQSLRRKLEARGMVGVS